MHASDNDSAPQHRLSFPATSMTASVPIPTHHWPASYVVLVIVLDRVANGLRM
jgi:hypothetical protein